MPKQIFHPSFSVSYLPRTKKTLKIFPLILEHLVVMKNLLPISFFSILIVDGTTLNLKSKELTLIFDLINEMEIRFCIFVSNTKLIANVKKISLNNVAGTQFNYEGLTNFLNEPNKVYFRTAIVLKDTKFHQLELIAESFHKVKQIESV